MATKTYRSYFQINESYFPAVNEDVIKTQPDVWKTYYPHSSFIQLLNQTKNVLNGNQKMSIWVEGPYGTGKSHAVLTLKKILDCSNEELKEYFDKYEKVFKTKDLYNEYYNLKNQSKKILTVHRYGSSDIRNDKALLDSIQESIIQALKQNGYSYLGQLGIKQAIIEWLSEENNKDYFNNIIQDDKYKIKFNGLKADEIIHQLESYTTDKAIQELIENISIVGEDRNIVPFVLKKENLKEWILDVIQKNEIKAIIFIWDEFSDYFTINKENLSGFQYLVELSETSPFYFVIVTHKSDIFFEGAKDEVKTKINGRFIAPHCSITLPDNMAFSLTMHALDKVKDVTIQKEWDDIVEALYDQTHDSRKEVMSAAKIGETELKGVLPIHPYAALVLKHIASAFDSNQRSMFDFIKNNRGDEIKGFQWYIDNYGPYDNENLLTIDMLWDFFYEKGKDQLAPQTRAVLDVFSRVESNKLSAIEKRVLKTILLLQAINDRVGGDVPLFVPNNKNLGMAFEGTDINATNVSTIAGNLVKASIIFERTMIGGEKKYSALTSNGNLEEIAKEKERLTKDIKTEKLLEEGQFEEDFKLPKYLEIRYPYVRCLTSENIKMEITRMKADSDVHPTRLYAVYTFARNEEESKRIKNEIQKTYESAFNKVVFIDYSSAHLSAEIFDRYTTNMANGIYLRSKDAGQANTYFKVAKEELIRWKNQIRLSLPRVYKYNDTTGMICNTEKDIFEALKMFDRDNYKYAIETYVNVIDNMYAVTALKQGAECGITQEVKGTFKANNDNIKLEKQFEGVWKVDNYWKTKPNELISKLKIEVEKVIESKMQTSTRVSISEIYEVLKNEPFAFMPCNLTAFILGFVLKEYASDIYNYTDSLTTEPMSVEKLKEMIDEVIKLQQTPSQKYRDKYIVMMSPEQRQFNKSTAIAFEIDESKCSSVENTRSFIRTVMTSYKFPIWTLKYHKFVTKTPIDIVNKGIDLYVELANNTESARSETDIALEIGKLYLENKDLEQDFKCLFNKNNCIDSMKDYLQVFKEGYLPEIAKKIGDSGTYVDEINKKFSESTNWVWNKETVDSKIDETITEFSIVFESNKLIPKTTSYNDCISEWQKKATNIKTAYLTIKSDVGAISDTLSIICQIKRNGYIYDSDKTVFLEGLKNNNKELKDFFENQVYWVKKAGAVYLDNLEDDDIGRITNNLFDVFDKENSEYLKILEDSVKAYKAEMSKYKLLSKWKEKTATSSPIDWSNKHNIPILCVSSENNQEDLRQVFSIINNPPLEKAKIDSAISYLEKTNIFEKLSDAKTREESFRKNVLRNYSILFEDINDAIKQIQSNHPEVLPYNWMDNIAINQTIEKIALEKYVNGFNKEVNKIIDSMSPEQLKVYLKELTKDNMVVGIEIINDKK